MMASIKFHNIYEIVTEYDDMLLLVHSLLVSIYSKAAYSMTNIRLYYDTVLKYWLLNGIDLFWYLGATIDLYITYIIKP